MSHVVVLLVGCVSISPISGAASGGIEAQQTDFAKARMCFEGEPSLTTFCNQDPNLPRWRDRAQGITVWWQQNLTVRWIWKSHIYPSTREANKIPVDPALLIDRTSCLSSLCGRDDLIYVDGGLPHGP